MTELAELGDASSPASTAYRQRIREHFNQLYDDTAILQAELDELAREASTVTDADLIAQLPLRASAAHRGTGRDPRGPVRRDGNPLHLPC
jgi:hypothetical protein